MGGENIRKNLLLHKKSQLASEGLKRSRHSGDVGVLGLKQLMFTYCVENVQPRWFKFASFFLICPASAHTLALSCDQHFPRAPGTAIAHLFLHTEVGGATSHARSFRSNIAAAHFRPVKPPLQCTDPINGAGHTRSTVPTGRYTEVSTRRRVGLISCGLLSPPSIPLPGGALLCHSIGRSSGVMLFR